MATGKSEGFCDISSWEILVKKYFSYYVIDVQLYMLHSPVEFAQGRIFGVKACHLVL